MMSLDILEILGVELGGKMKRRRSLRIMEKKQRKRRKRRKVRRMMEDTSGRTAGPLAENTATGLKINRLSQKIN